MNKKQITRLAEIIYFQQELLTVQDISCYLNLSISRINKLVKERNLPVWSNENQKKIFLRNDIEKWCRSTDRKFGMFYIKMFLETRKETKELEEHNEYLKSRIENLIAEKNELERELSRLKLQKNKNRPFLKIKLAIIFGLLLVLIGLILF